MADHVELSAAAVRGQLSAALGEALEIPARAAQVTVCVTGTVS